MQPGAADKLPEPRSDATRSGRGDSSPGGVQPARGAGAAVGLSACRLPPAGNLAAAAAVAAAAAAGNGQLSASRPRLPACLCSKGHKC